MLILLLTFYHQNKSEDFSHNLCEHLFDFLLKADKADTI